MSSALVVCDSDIPPTGANIYEMEQLQTMKTSITEILEKPQGCHLSVKDFLSEAKNNSHILTVFLRGRHYDPQLAFKTLLRYAFARFKEYPSLYKDPLPDKARLLYEANLLGFLKCRDLEGRRIMLFNATAWDPDQFSFDELIILGEHLLRSVSNDKKSLEKGFIFVQQCDRTTFKHAQQYTIFAMKKLLHVFWLSCPMEVRGVYFVNVPLVFSLVYKGIRPILPKDLTDRINISSTSNFELQLHKDIGRENLPECVNGKLKMANAFEKFAL